jgi:hypothetical protein
MWVFDQFGNECLSERSQIYFENDKRLSSTRGHTRCVTLLYQPTFGPHVCRNLPVDIVSRGYLGLNN